jgi:hypothetical protein
MTHMQNGVGRHTSKHSRDPLGGLAAKIVAQRGCIDMYVVRKSGSGYAIFYIEEKRKEYISDNLSLKQATKWCERLNAAYNKGCASNW